MPQNGIFFKPNHALDQSFRRKGNVSPQSGSEAKHEHRPPNDVYIQHTLMNLTSIKFDIRHIL